MIPRQTLPPLLTNLGPSTDSLSAASQSLAGSPLTPNYSFPLSANKETMYKTRPSRSLSMTSLRTASMTPPSTPPPRRMSISDVRKAAHKLQEQKRREKLRSCFDQLLNLLPVNFESLANSEKLPNRVEILTRTIDYIHQLNSRNQQLITELKKYQ